MPTILDRLNKRREQLQEQLESIQTLQRELVERGVEAREEVKEKVRVMESQALGQALELLEKANDTIDGRSSLLKRGQTAIEDILVDVRAGQESTLGIEDFDELSIKKILPSLDAMNPIDLKAVRAYEANHKDRVTLLREIDKRLEETAEADESDA